jgi:UDP-N-acetylmuramyl pentapeptide phosphotransferase/UDP-N-acetylglucosamine-1-phosphate transferase
MEQALTGSAGSFWLLLACMIPGFAWGLIEDLYKRGAVFARLVLTGMTPVLAYILLDARITEVALPVVDRLLAFHVIGFAFTVFAVTGVAHAINVIDGLNGLASMTALIAAAGLALIAWAVGDSFVFCASAVLAASLAGFLVVNYPRGRVFLGDGGAYLLGLMLAVLSVLLVHRNPEVSAWFPMVLLAYPVCETLFSAYRRRRRGKSPGEADALHLHSLVYRRIVRWKGHGASAADCMTRNALASLLVWSFPVMCWLLAIAYWDNTRVLQVAALAFVALYLVLYRRIVRFSVPTWMVIHKRFALPVAPTAKVDVHAEHAPEGR